MNEIAPIKGLIELQDDFTSKLGLAEIALSKFSEKNQQSLTACAQAAALVTGAVVAIGVATVELGQRGSAVNDLAGTLEEFAGSGEAAASVMDSLRKGTRDTVDNFALAQNAAHLLSTDVKLTAEDFHTLGEASFVLADRGLGSTEEQLKLVSDALVTGRTRALAMSLGVIENTNAEEDYAKKLGTTKEFLSESGKVEARRQEVMRLLGEATKSAANIQDDFADRIDKGKTKVKNWIDELGSAVDKSDVFAAGMDAIGEAFSEAFGDDKGELIEEIVGWVEDLAITLIDFAQIAVSMSKIVDNAWNAVKMVVLAVTTAVVAGADLIMEAVTGAAIVSEKLGIISAETLAGVKETRDMLRSMTMSLAEQTAEAAGAIVATSEFDKKMDGLNETLQKVQNAMANAKVKTVEQEEAEVSLTSNTTKLTAAQNDLNDKMIDRQKVSDALTKSTKELEAIQADYFALVTSQSGTTRDAQIADIEATFKANVASLDKLDPLMKEKYAAFRAIANAQLKGIESDWNSVRDVSIQGMQEQADKALATYHAMLSSGLTFRREVLDAQLDKWRELQAAANGWGTTVADSIDTAVQAVKVLDAAWVTNADIAEATLSRTTVMVRTLAGELISLQEAQKRQSQGGSFNVDSSNFDETIRYYQDNIRRGGGRQYRDPYELARLGYSFQEIVKFAFNEFNQGPLPPPQGPRIPGMATGGVVMVGERGPEVVSLPVGAAVYPSGSQPAAPSTTQINLTFYVNGTAEEAARKISAIIMRDLKQIRQFGSA